VGITIEEPSDKIVVKVKTLSEKPLRVEILPKATVGELKDVIKKLANAEGKFLRLIHQGKMLSDDKATLESCKVKSDDFVHCAISAAPPKAVVSQVCPRAFIPVLHMLMGSRTDGEVNQPRTDGGE
jgi:hypothetical protein